MVKLEFLYHFYCSFFSFEAPEFSAVGARDARNAVAIPSKFCWEKFGQIWLDLSEI